VATVLPGADDLDAGGDVDRATQGRAADNGRRDDATFRLRQPAGEITLIYDPRTKTLRPDSPGAVTTVTGRAS